MRETLGQLDELAAISSSQESSGTVWRIAFGGG
jgi:hypothetical protein